MAKITSKSGLNVGTELTISTSGKTIGLNVAGNLVAKDGVTMKALYSKLVELWNTSTYNDYDFPMYAKDNLAGEYTMGYNGTSYNGWTFLNDATRSYIRDAGWSEYNSSGVLQKQYVGLFGLGTLASSGSQPYYQIVSGGSATDFSYTDMPNEAIKVYDVSASLDSRTYAKLYIRTYNYTYTEWDMTESGFTGTGAYKIPFVLNNLADSKIQANDATVAASSPYTGITATWITGNNFDTTNTSPYVVDDVVQDGAGRWYICTGNGTADATDYADLSAMAGAGTATFTPYTGERQIGSSYYAFNIIIDGNSATKEQIYTKVQYLLRQNSDIDSGSGTHTGKITAELMSFAGDTLTTSTGVYIDSYLLADKNNIQFTDVGGTVRSNPFAVQISLTFDSLLTSGGTGKYRLFFTTNPSGNWGTANAVTVNDATGTAIQGTITGSTISTTFDYDGNVQGGRTAGTDAAVTMVVVNPGSSKPVTVTATITRSSAMTIASAGVTDYGYTASGLSSTTFNGSTKVVTLPSSTTTMSVLALWSRWVDWLTTTSNMKYATAMSQVGGQTIDGVAGTSIPKYIFMENSWQVQPNSADHTLAVTAGIILVNGGGDPFLNSTGYTVKINYQQPVQAITVTTSSGGSSTESDYFNASTGEYLIPLN